MPLQYPAILDLGMRGQPLQYDERDTMLYALTIGMGADPLAADELNFVYEKNLRAVPSFASTVAWHAGLSFKELGLDYTLALHAGEEAILHRPLPPAATLLADSSIEAVYDKGPNKGALIVRKIVLMDAGDKQPIATVRKTMFARGDGGSGGGADMPPSPPAMPQRAPDRSLQIPTRPEQALLYRLCGDRNPLHADPHAAHAAGFAAPILHGLCTYGITCRAVMKTFCNNDPARIHSHSVRFSAPVYPGDVLMVDLWRDADTVLFEVRVAARNARVITGGKTLLQSASSMPG